MIKLECSIRALLVTFISLTDLTEITAQSLGTAQPVTSGWSVSQPPAGSPMQSAVVQTAYYQSPGPDFGLPPPPSANAGMQTGNFGNPNVLPPTLPSMPNALQPVQSSGGLSDFDNPSFSNANQPSPQPQYNQPQYNQPLYNQPQYNQPQYNQQPYDPYSTQPSQVYPPESPMVRTAGASEDLRAVQNNPNANPGSNLRNAAPTMPSGFGPNSRPVAIATGLPYVTPAPRTGNYPTSPINNSVFRTASYQNVVQSYPVQVGPGNANVANTQPVLPQYQNAPVMPAPVMPAPGKPTPGIYPAQNQCAPGTTATYPLPGAVAGSYVPPTVTPNLAPSSYSPNNAGYSPLFSMGQDKYNVQVGRGIVGQPTVYVPGQPFRNFFRYLAP